MNPKTRVPENLTESETGAFMILRNSSDEECRLEQERISVDEISKELLRYGT